MNIADNPKLAASLAVVEATPLITFRVTLVAPNIVVTGNLISRAQYLTLLEKTIKQIDPYKMSRQSNFPPYADKNALEAVIETYQKSRYKELADFAAKYESVTEIADEVFMQGATISCSGYPFEHSLLRVPIADYSAVFVGEMETLSEVPRS